MQTGKSGPVLALYQLIRIRNEISAFVKGNWNEKYAISAELEQKFCKVIDSKCEKRGKEKSSQMLLATMQG